MYWELNVAERLFQSSSNLDSINDALDRAVSSLNTSSNRTLNAPWPCYHRAPFPFYLACCSKETGRLWFEHSAHVLFIWTGCSDGLGFTRCFQPSNGVCREISSHSTAFISAPLPAVLIQDKSPHKTAVFSTLLQSLSWLRGIILPSCEEIHVGYENLIQSHGSDVSGWSDCVHFTLFKSKEIDLTIFSVISNNPCQRLFACVIQYCLLLLCLCVPFTLTKSFHINSVRD